MRLLWIVAAALFIAACGHGPIGPDTRTTESADGGPDLASFSRKRAGGDLPASWQPWTLSALKRPTDYALVDYNGHTVLQARADGSASGLIHSTRFDPRHFPMLSWRWKVTSLIDRADNSRAWVEDSPVRIVVAFEGDVSRLKPMDRLVFNQFRMFTKTELPYATLMYIWENRAPAGTIITSPHTSRIKMIVADSGKASVGQWCERRANLYEDYRRAFGEEPPPVKWIGVMTDTDNTQSSTLAYYGDIRVARAPRSAMDQ